MTEETNKELLKAATIAAQIIEAHYQWVDRVKNAGGTTCIAGIAEAHAMLSSFEKNRDRVNKLVMDPLRGLIADERWKQP